MARTVASTTDASLNARRTVGGSRDTPSRPARNTAAKSESNTRSFRQGAAEGSKAKPAGKGRTAGRGFGAWNEKVKESKDFSTFQVPADATKVVVFLEPENYDMVFRHWVPTVTDDGRSIRVPRNCIEDPDSAVRCPLCDVGDEPKPVALFNVIDLDAPDKVQLWEAGKEVMKRIESLYGTLQEIPEDRGGPLELNSDGVYASVKREKKSNGYWEYTILRVKERDLDEDHGLDPITPEQVEAALENLNTSEDIKFNTVDELRELAAKLED